jgi:small subunit ribosomal protein S29
MLARAAARTASAVARVAPPVATAAWVRGFGSSDGDENAAAEGARSEAASAEDARDTSEEDPEASDSDDEATPPGSVTAEAAEDDALDDRDDDRDEGAAGARPAIGWTGGVEPHRPAATGREQEGTTFSLATRSGDDVLAFDAKDVDRFWELSAEEEARLMPEGAPAGLAAEFAASGTRRVLFRACDLQVRELLKGGTSLLMDGRRGCGKSAALANAVAWARAAGYFVVYVPSAKALTLDSSYQKDEASGKWDTPEHAARLLRWMLAGNEAAMGAMRVKAPGGEDTSLAALAAEGVQILEKGGDPKAVTEAALAALGAVRDAARSGTHKVLFAIDEYNALFGPTDMHEVLGARKRGVIQAGDTRVGAALRDAAAATAAGATFVGATSGTISLSAKLSAALGDDAREAPASAGLRRLEVPRFNPREIVCLVRHYDHARRGLDAVDKSVDHEQLALRLKVLTQGNAKEMREMIEALG